MTDMLTTLGQELAGFTQKKEGIDITTNHDQHNNYQDMIAKDLINDVIFALSNSNDTTVSDKPIIIQANSIEEYLALQNNNAEFSELDKEAGDNSIFIFRDKVIATDGIDDKKVIFLTGKETSSLNLKKAYTKNEIYFIDKQDLSMFEKVFDLGSEEDFEAIRKNTDMDYVEINNDTKQVFWNGMNNTFAAAKEISGNINKDFKNTGLFSNKTGQYGLLCDYFEWKPNYLTTKDVLNAEQLSKLQDGTTVITHSAGNEDIYKAMKVGNLVNMKYPINIISVGSPRSKTDLEDIGNKVQIKSIVQINHHNDPIANGFVNKDANYDINYTPSKKGIIYKVPIIGDLIDNHTFDNYYNNYGVKEKIKEISNNDK